MASVAALLVCEHAAVARAAVGPRRALVEAHHPARVGVVQDASAAQGAKHALITLEGVFVHMSERNARNFRHFHKPRPSSAVCSIL